MPLEIERKFLVAHEGWRAAAGPGTRLAQGYLCADADRTVRIRLAGDEAWLTVKGPTEGISRAEFEYPIPAAEAREMLDLCLPSVIEKTRHRLDFEGFTWEIDEFHGENEGLLLAEVELASADQSPPLPGWLGPEVSDDPRYANSRLARHPFGRWAQA
jgi:adenylate cyclase